ncbi:monovalent cation:proton antiporter-2 (CPA2) family protein [Parvularcula marina]|uniref:monovalent cation:proton antiporter-2 (CPA2) family protein n=1 Tax=Parvularcula marina TaxID=2292771 RepID=UPI003514DC40
MAATGTENEFLFQAAIYLGATAVAVPLFRKLKLGTVLGFLAAGILLGPSGFGLLHQEEGVFHVAELGVVLFLFVIGLELSFGRLWSLRTTIFGLGLSQMTVTGLVIAGGLHFAGLFAPGPSLIIGFALACSSTAFALSLLEERREMNTGYGVKAFSVLLFQDMAVIPLLAAIPVVAARMNGDGEGMAFGFEDMALAVLALIAVIVISKYVVDFVFQMVARSGSREAFTAAALCTVAGTALIVDWAGLSMALGAFLAGVVLAESTFRHQIESDIEPFREVFLGLFFIGVGMQVDLDIVFANWQIVLAAAVGLIVLKSAILFVLALIFGAKLRTASRAAVILSQGGEFGFVVFSLSVGREILTSEMATILSAIVTLSMIATPMLVIAVNRATMPKREGVQESEDLSDVRGRVLVVGYGRMGQLVNQILLSSNVETIAIDSDPRRIRAAADFGNKVYFGDGTNVNLLVQAGALDVDAIIFTLNARERLKPIVEAIRERCPNVRILVRLFDRLHEIEMMDVKTDYGVRELFESSLMLARQTLQFLDFSDSTIDDIMAEFRERDRDRILAQKAEGIYAKKEVMRKPFEAVEEGES